MSDKIINHSHIVCLAAGVRLRREYFGGLVYDRRNGTTIEVDKAAFEFFSRIKNGPQKISDVLDFLIQNRIIKQKHPSIHDTLQKFFELNVIEIINGVSPAFLPKKLNEAKHMPWLSAPETVHWAVTYRCDEGCPDCYAGRFSFIKNELNTHESLRLIDKIAAWNVFQLAIGGGEPFARNDLQPLAQHAAAQGLSVHITTGKMNIAPDVLESIAPFIKNLQIGIRNNDLLGPKSKEYIQQLQSLFTHAQKLRIKPGANLFLTKSTILQVKNIIRILINIGFDRIIFLRYKPPKSMNQWKDENPDSCQMKTLHDKIEEIMKRDPHLNIRVDCSLSFVQRHLPGTITTQHGIKGCVAADRILALAPDGSVYPCSQLVHPDYSAGNLLTSEPEVLWNTSKILRKYRSFHTKKTFIHSRCGSCLAKKSCGGCRVFAMDGLGCDPGCPEPILPELTQTGKLGRQMDLLKYLERNYEISVGEYMDRYGVSQKKAIKELNASPEASSATGKSARKKVDTYRYVRDDIIQDIQNDIGCTSGGAPFASYEEVAQWIDDPSYWNNYPQWIKSKGEENNENIECTQGISG